MATRLTTHLAAVLLAASLLTAPIATAKPTSPLCEDGSYRSRHPLICNTGDGPFTIAPGGGGGSSGLLERLGDIIGGIGGLGGL